MGACRCVQRHHQRFYSRAIGHAAAARSGKPAGDAAIEGTVTDFGSDDNGGGDDLAENLTVQPDGKIVAAG